MLKRTHLRSVFVLVLAVLPFGAAQAVPSIGVTVNGTPVAFTGALPVEIKGAVLVPLRGVFQALGASVAFDPVTKVISAKKGSSTVTLPLGATAATVNGRPQALSQPAQEISGTTLVPLRFVAQALGAYVEWQAAANTVQIKTAEPHLATLPAAPGKGPVVGLVTGVYSDTNPQTITVRVNGVNTSVPLTPQTTILRSAPGEAGTQAALTQLQAGDQVTVQRDSSGAALSVTAVYGEVRGTIKSIGAKTPNGERVLTLNDGTTLDLIPDVPVMMAGRHIVLGDVMANENVVVRTDQTNKTGYGIAVVTPDNPDPTPPGQAPEAAAGPVTPPGAPVPGAPAPPVVPAAP